jgi:hypothetical protein
MLSIIICHRRKELLSALKSNIEETIGIPYELVVIDNSENNYSILSAYNEGVKKAKYDLLCFSHEDILFHTKDWGKKVITHFEDSATEMIAVAGALAQSEIPSAWWYNNYFAKSVNNVLMPSNDKNDKKLYHYKTNPAETKTEVAVIDGVWFCIRKSLFDEIAFDEKTFKGFHLYDMDISMQVSQHSKVFVVNDILLQHFSNGKITQSYYEDLISFTEKWKPYLPVQNEKVEQGYIKFYNWHALRRLVLDMKDWNISESFIQQTFKKYYPVVKKKWDSKWFRTYFFFCRLFGYKFITRVFFKLEQLVGFSKTSEYIQSEYRGN